VTQTAAKRPIVKTPIATHIKADVPTLREQILADFAALRVPLSMDDFDPLLRRAEQEGLSHLEFLRLLIGQQAQQRRERAIEHRIREARFREVRLLADFDWQFNAQAIDRLQIEALASGEFVRRKDNLILVGQSGVGKSFLLQALGRQLCVLGYRVRYVTSADLLRDLTAALADQTLPQRTRYYARFDLLILDEFGFDKIERGECPQAANLLYKVIDARNGHASTALATNIDFEHWGDYLGDPPLAMAFLDRVVDGALLMKVKGQSYRAHRAQRADQKAAPKTATPSDQKAAR
jgi:DNA replication protein DnaC